MFIPWSWLRFGIKASNLIKYYRNNLKRIYSSFVGVLLPTIPILIYNGSNAIPPEGKRILLLLRCFVGTMGLMLSFYAFRHMSLSDASVIIFSTPVFVVIFAKIFLNEPCGVFNVVTIFFTLMGVVLITRPPLLFNGVDESSSSWSSAPKHPMDLFRNSTVDLLDFSPNGYDKSERYSAGADDDSQSKFDIWGPVAAISSTLFGAVIRMNNNDRLTGSCN